MNIHDATETAYKNGYKQGVKDARKWISVKDRLPERYKYILLWDAMDRDIFMGVLDDKREWYVPGYQDEPFNITHWMPLPEPPKGE